MAYEVWGFVHIMDRVATRAKYRLELWDRYSSQLFGFPAWFFDCVSCERFFDKLERLTYCLGDAEIEDDKVTALVCHAEMLEIVQLYGEALGRGSPVNRVRFVQFCWHTFLDHGELRCFGPKRIGVRSISALELYGECRRVHAAAVAIQRAWRKSRKSCTHWRIAARWVKRWLSRPDSDVTKGPTRR